MLAADSVTAHGDHGGFGKGVGGCGAAENAAATRAAILEAAKTAFAVTGYDRTSLRDIAAGQPLWHGRDGHCGLHDADHA